MSDKKWACLIANPRNDIGRIAQRNFIQLKYKVALCDGLLCYSFTASCVKLR